MEGRPAVNDCSCLEHNTPLAPRRSRAPATDGGRCEGCGLSLALRCTHVTPVTALNPSNSAFGISNARLRLECVRDIPQLRRSLRRNNIEVWNDQYRAGA